MQENMPLLPHQKSCRIVIGKKLHPSQMFVVTTLLKSELTSSFALNLRECARLHIEA